MKTANCVTKPAVAQPNVKINAALYGRVSTQDQHLESQLQPCRDWCNHNGVPFTEYLDKVSGTKTSREALDRMMADIKAGRIQAVICYKLDRLGRSMIHLAGMIEEFDKFGVAFICTSQGIDTRASNPAGRFQMHILMAVAAFERSLISERTKAGLQATKKRGVILGRRMGSGKPLPVNEARLLMKPTVDGGEGKSIREASRALGIPLTTLRWGLKRYPETSMNPIK